MRGTYSGVFLNFNGAFSGDQNLTTHLLIPKKLANTTRKSHCVLAMIAFNVLEFSVTDNFLSIALDAFMGCRGLNHKLT